MLALLPARPSTFSQFLFSPSPDDFDRGFCSAVTHYVPSEGRTDSIIRWGVTEFLRERVRSARAQLDPQ